MTADYDNISLDSAYKISLWAASHGRSENPRCSAEDCNKTTREGKPYCSEHIMLSPYVAQILEELKIKDEEEKKLSNGEEISQEGHLIRETLLLLEQASYTSAKLSRLVDISHTAAEALIMQMHRLGLARISRGEHGGLMVSRIRSTIKN